VSRVRVIRTSVPVQPAIASTSSSRWKQIGIVILMVLHHLLAFSPLLIVVALYAASWRAEGLIGHWPQPMVDDPWYVIPDDGLYRFLLLSIFPLLYCVLGAIVSLPALTLVLWRRYPLLWTVFLAVIFVGGLLLIKSDPEQRFIWLMD